MTLTRDIIGTALCTDAKDAKHLTVGKRYRVVAEFELDGTDYINVLNDRGTLFAYPAQRFQWKGKQ